MKYLTPLLLAGLLLVLSEFGAEAQTPPPDATPTAVPATATPVPPTATPDNRTTSQCEPFGVTYQYVTRRVRDDRILSIIATPFCQRLLTAPPALQPPPAPVQPGASTSSSIPTTSGGTGKKLSTGPAGNKDASVNWGLIYQPNQPFAMPVSGVRIGPPSTGDGGLQP